MTDHRRPGRRGFGALGWSGALSRPGSLIGACMLLVAVAACTGGSPSSATPARPEPLLADDVIYMVMLDRFANGDPGNDRGEADDDAGVLDHGFDPTSTGYYHGGDLVGLTGRLDYLQGLGVTALWVTPVLRNRPVQGDGTVDGSSAGYHGYWQLDFTEIDPHLGTEAEFQAFVDAAHERDMKVILDVVVNHTADVIAYDGPVDGFVPTPIEPYLDASGEPFDVRAVAGTDAFPELDAAVSFPLTPVIPPELADAKAPDFLDDPTNYHNRGPSTFSGESQQFGDFFGLDDLFTEKPEVVEGMIDVHAELVATYGVDGFRVDTVKHVNDEFWSAWLPAIHDAGGESFAVFGEVVEVEPAALARYMTDVGFGSVIDVRLDDAVERFAAVGAPTDELAAFFAGDDWFTDADSSAHDLVTVISSHDFGRLGGAIDRAARGGARSDAERLARMRLGLSVQFLSRGTPIVYYGDEQGFASVGDDQAVREDMFPSSTPEYQQAPTIGSDATPADDNFDPGHPLYETIAELAALRAGTPALRTGAQTVVASGPEAGLVAWTRRGSDGVEYLVALNNAGEPVTGQATTLTPSATFTPVYGAGVGADADLQSGADGTVDLALEPFAVGVWVADQPASTIAVGDDLAIERIGGASIFGRDLEVRLTGELRAPATVVFEQRVVGTDDWQLIGVDDAAPYVVYTDPDDAPDDLELRAVIWLDDEPMRTLTG